MSQLQSWWETPPTPPPADGKSPDLDFSKLDPEALPAPISEKLLTRRIHILGTGSIGTFVAHSLALLPNPPPITLLFHRPQMYGDFVSTRKIVRLINKETGIQDEQTGFDVDVQDETNTPHPFWEHIPAINHDTDLPMNPLNDEEMMRSKEVYIYTLIVTVKGPSTVRALKSIQHRIDANTTVLLMQNGMGQIDLLNAQVFTDPKKRPTYMLGVISHGCHMAGHLAVVHAGFGAVALGIHRDTNKFPLPPPDTSNAAADLSEEERKQFYPSDADLYHNLSSRYLLRTLTRSPVLACAAYPYLDLLQLQLEKLVSNCVLNPLTALFDVENGAMLTNQPLSRVHRLLIAEISLVIRSLPELEGIPNVRHRFSASRLEQFFRAICNKTAANSSSMREDIRRVKETEIDFINGYIVKRGKELGIKCVLNYMVMQLVKARHDYDRMSGARIIPKGLSVQKAMQEGDAVVLEDVEGRAAESEAEAQQDEYVPFSS